MKSVFNFRIVDERDTAVKVVGVGLRGHPRVRNQRRLETPELEVRRWGGHGGPPYK